MTCSAAALLKGVHAATYFESTTNITDIDRNEWESTRVIVID